MALPQYVLVPAAWAASFQAMALEFALVVSNPRPNSLRIKTLILIHLSSIVAKPGDSSHCPVYLIDAVLNGIDLAFHVSTIQCECDHPHSNARCDRQRNGSPDMGTEIGHHSCLRLPCSETMIRPN
jgi:hypothetical protein